MAEVKVTNQSRLLNILRTGACFGEMAHLTREKFIRTASVCALSRITVIEIKSERLQQPILFLVTREWQWCPLKFFPFQINTDITLQRGFWAGFAVAGQCRNEAVRHRFAGDLVACVTRVFLPEVLALHHIHTGDHHGQKDIHPGHGHLERRARAGR